MAEQLNSLNIIRFNKLQESLGISKSGLYDRLNPKSPRYDPTFPKRLKLGGRAVGFVESEVKAWVKNRMDARC